VTRVTGEGDKDSVLVGQMEKLKLTTSRFGAILSLLSSDL